MKNFPFEHNGKTYWHSRSMAVAVFVYTTINNELHILMNKRGEGAPDFVGYWSVPCGYLDYNETLSQAGARELFEECGLNIDHSELIPMCVNSTPNDNRQNVTQRYMTYLPYERFKESGFSTINSEIGEVEEIKWIPIKQLHLGSFKIAFNHDEIGIEYSKYASIYSSVESLYINQNLTSFSNIPNTPSIVDMYGMMFYVTLEKLDESVNNKLKIENDTYNIIAYPYFNTNKANPLCGEDRFYKVFSHLYFPNIKIIID